MNSSILTEYSKELPEEVKDLLVGLSDPENLGLLVALMKHGKMSFNEMKQKFQLSPSSLTNRLTVLQDGSLIENFYEKTDRRSFSYYDVTDVPEQIFESAYNVLYSPSMDSSNIAIPKIERDEQPIQPADAICGKSKLLLTTAKYDQRTGSSNQYGMDNNTGT